MNSVSRKYSCKNHKPTFEDQGGGSVTYFCGSCGWRGRFNVTSDRKPS